MTPKSIRLFVPGEMVLLIQHSTQEELAAILERETQPENEDTPPRPEGDVAPGDRPEPASGPERPGPTSTGDRPSGSLQTRLKAALKAFVEDVVFKGITITIDLEHDILDFTFWDSGEFITDEPFSLVFARNLPAGLSVRKDPDDEGRIFSRTTEEETDGAITDAQLSQCVIQLYEIVAKGKLARFEEVFQDHEDNNDNFRFTLRAATPHWFLSGNPTEPPDGIGGGGPGAIPVKDDIPPRFRHVSIRDDEAPWRFHWDLQIPPLFPADALRHVVRNMPGVWERVTGRRVTETSEIQDEVRTASARMGDVLTTPVEQVENIEVAILDTVPPPEDIDSIAGSKGWLGNHPLIDNLFEQDPDDPTKVRPNNLSIKRRPEYHPDRGKDWVPPPDEFDIARAVSSCYPYPATDHGIFIAGVIRSFAPDVRIHLIEALNSYGVGNLEIIASQLRYAYESARQNGVKFLIVNMSLMFDFPWDEHHLIRACIAPCPPTLAPLTRELITQQAFAENMASPLEWICKLLQVPREDDDDTAEYEAAAENTLARIVANGGVVIAAAGNDGYRADGPNPRARARFPAAYDTVLGVGALTRDFQPTIYSNSSDAPLEAGIAVFGGEMSDQTEVLRSKKPGGMLGVYLGKFPDPNMPLADAFQYALDDVKGKQEHLLDNDTGWARWSGTSFATAVMSGYFALLVTLHFTGSNILDNFYFILRALLHQSDTREYYLRIKQ